MIKRIQVCTDGSQNSHAACEYGISLAQKLKAKLTGIHVLDSRMLEGPLMADISGWIGAQPYGSQLQQFRDVLEQKGNTIVDAFDERCQAAGINGEGTIRMGHPSRVLLEEETHAELIILGQRGIHADLIGNALGSTAERVVRQSIKPCMVVPTQFKPISKLLAAYDGSNYSSKALHQAIELAKALEVELIILAVAEGKEAAQAEEASREAMDLAEAHECQAISLVSEDDHAAESIITNAEEQGADLIVMGAYGHGRIRQWVLGSTTTYVLTHTDIPAMMVH